MTSITPISPAASSGVAPDLGWMPPASGGCSCQATDQAAAGVDSLGIPPGKDAGGGGGFDAYPDSSAPVTLGSSSTATARALTSGGSAPIDGFPTSPTGVSEADQAASRDQNVSPEGLVPQARRNLDRANEWGLHLTGGVGDWNEWHADGSSVDVSNYAGGGVGSETPEMRAYANEMYELGKAGVKGPDGGLLVTHLVYAGMRAGASTNWQWEPVSQPDDLTQGHWDHVHVETDSWV